VPWRPPAGIQRPGSRQPVTRRPAPETRNPRPDASRIARTRAGRGMLAMRAIEVGAAVLIVAFGILLLAGYLASEQLRMFNG
jgi:hypothetical protein